MCCKQEQRGNRHFFSTHAPARRALRSLNLAGSETVHEVLHVLADVVDQVERGDQVMVASCHLEDLCEDVDALAGRDEDGAPEAQQRRMARVAVIDEDQVGVPTDVAVDASGHRDVVRSRRELGLVAYGQGPEELSLALEVQPVDAVRRGHGGQTGPEVRPDAERLDLEGTVGHELTGDTHVGPRLVAQVVTREQPGLGRHRLVSSADVDGCGYDTTAHGIVQGLVQSLDHAYDSWHLKLLRF